MSVRIVYHIARELAPGIFAPQQELVKATDDLVGKEITIRVWRDHMCREVKGKIIRTVESKDKDGVDCTIELATPIPEMET